MERATASPGVRSSARLILFGRCVHLRANGSDFRPRGGTRENERESVGEVENGNDCEKLFHEYPPEGGASIEGAGVCERVRLNVNGVGFRSWG